MAAFDYEIVKELGVLSENEKGWKKEVNIVSYNGTKPKVDIRAWAPDHEKMGKGVTLNNEEIEELKEILDSIENIFVELDGANKSL